MKTEAYKMQQAKNKELRAVVFILIVTIIVLFGGCANKPEVITKVEYQRQVVPVKCNVTIPEKPNYDPSDLETAKNLGIYYSDVEVLLGRCVNGVVK